MLRLMSVLVISAALVTGTNAQDRAPYTCPNLSIVTADRLLEPHETAKFTANINTFGADLRFKYRWYISSGSILSGQGTTAIEVTRPPGSAVVATLNISGTPDDSHCPVAHNQIARWNAPPVMERIALIRGTSIDANLNGTDHWSSQLSYFPKDHFYIFIGHKPDAAEEDLSRREREIIYYLPNSEGRSRVTIVRVPGDDVTEFWRLPPGSAIPTCGACRPAACPKLSVIGPAGIVQPGEYFTFAGNVEGKIPGNVAYEWKVTGGRIIEGQGTLKMSTDAEWNAGGATLTATLNVLGLPDGCVNSVSESAGVACQCAVILIDEFGRLTNQAIRKRLNKLFTELANNPNDHGYIILYGTDKEISARERLIAKSVIFRSFDRARITIVRGGTHPDEVVFTKLYRIPPGAENPTP